MTNVPQEVLDAFDDNTGIPQEVQAAFEVPVEVQNAFKAYPDASALDSLMSFPKRFYASTMSILPNTARWKRETEAVELNKAYEAEQDPERKALLGRSLLSKNLEALEAQWKADKAAQEVVEARPKGEESFPMEVVGSAVESSAPTLAAILTMLGTRNPTLATGVGVLGGGITEGSGIYQEARTRGASVEEADTSGTFGAVVGGGTEMLPLDALFRQGSSLLRRAGETAGKEFLQEGGTELLQNYEQKYSWDQERAHEEIWKEALKAGLAGVVMGGSAAGITHATSPYLRNSENQDVANELGLSLDKKYSAQQDDVLRELAAEMDRMVVWGDVPEGLLMPLKMHGAQIVQVDKEQDLGTSIPSLAVIMPWDMEVPEGERVVEETLQQTAVTMDADEALDFQTNLLHSIQKNPAEALRTIVNNLSHVIESQRILGPSVLDLADFLRASGKMSKESYNRFVEALYKTVNNVNQYYKTRISGTSSALKTLSETLSAAAQKRVMPTVEMEQEVIVLDNLVRQLETITQEAAKKKAGHVDLRPLVHYMTSVKASGGLINTFARELAKDSRANFPVYNLGFLNRFLNDLYTFAVERQNGPIAKFLVDWDKNKTQTYGYYPGPAASPVGKFSDDIYTLNKPYMDLVGMREADISIPLGQQIRTGDVFSEYYNIPGLPTPQEIVSLGVRWLNALKLSDSMSIMVKLDNAPGVLGSQRFDPRTNTIIITMNPDTIATMSNPYLKFMETFSHELGHGVSIYLLKNSSPEIQEALRRAWAESIKATLTKTYNDWFLIRRGPATSSDKAYLPATKVIENEIGRHVVGESSGDMTTYLLGFTEWLAHQFERGLYGSFDVATPEMKQFLHEILAKNKELAEAVRAEGGLEFNEIYKNFLEYHKQKAEEVANELREAMATYIEGALIKRSPSSVVAAVFYTKAIAKEVGVTEQDMTNTVAQGTFNRISNAINKVLGKPATQGLKQTTQQLSKDMDVFNERRAQWGGLLQLAWRNPHITELQTYTRLVEEWANKASQWKARANATVKMFHKLGPKRAQQLTSFMLSEVQAGKYYDLLDEAVMKQLKARFPLLNEESFAVYKQIKADFFNFIEEVEQAHLAEVKKRLVNKPFELIRELVAIQEKYAKLKQVPYFPATRFGRHLVYIKSTKDQQYQGRFYKDGEVMGFYAFESKRERGLFAKKLASQYPSAMVFEDEAKESHLAYMNMPRPLLEALKMALSQSSAFAPGDTLARQTILDDIDEFLYKMAPSQSWVKHMIQRDLIHGYSLDGIRVYSNYFVHGANHLARILYSSAISDAVQQTQLSADAVTGLPGNPISKSRRRLIANWVSQHYSYIMNPENDWAQARAVVAMAYLAGVIKSAVVNLSQVPMFTFPYLSSVYGEASTIAALSKAYKDLPRTYRLVKGLNVVEQNTLTKFSQQQPLTPAEQKIVAKIFGSNIRSQADLMQATHLMAALNEAVNAGYLDESNATELAALSEGGWLSRYTATSKGSYYWRTLTHGLMLPFQEAEKINRRVTFVAAFNLEYKASGGNAEKAYQAARNAVYKTQFEYSKWNRAPMLRGKKGIFFMFWQYQLNALAQISSNPQFFWRWALLHSMMAGALGWPFAENIADLIDFIMTRLAPNRRGDIRYEAQKQLEEIFGYFGSDLVLHGLSRYLGPYDLSGSFSMGRIVPATDVVFGPTGVAQGVVNSLPGTSLAPVSDAQDLFSKTATETGGAFTALIMRFFQAIANKDVDTWKRIEQGMPITMLRQMIDAGRAVYEGNETTGKGVSTLEYDFEDPKQMAEVAGKFLGFAPRAAATGRREEGVAQEGNLGRDEMWLISRTLEYYRIRREMLSAAYVNAVQKDDEEQLEIAKEAIMQFNDDVGQYGLGIKASQLRESVKRKMQTQQRMAAGLGQGMNKQIIQQLQEREY